MSWGPGALEGDAGLPNLKCLELLFVGRTPAHGQIMHHQDQIVVTNQ
jgi:hypothetical protein